MNTFIALAVIFALLLIAAWILTQFTVIKAAQSCEDCCDVFDDDNPDQAVHRESAGNWCKCGCDC